MDVHLLEIFPEEEKQKSEVFARNRSRTGAARDLASVGILFCSHCHWGSDYCSTYMLETAVSIERDVSSNILVTKWTAYQTCCIVNFGCCMYSD